MKLEFSLHILEKSSQYQISWKTVQWEPTCSMRTDGHDEANSCVPQFCERTKTSSRRLQ